MSNKAALTYEEELLLMADKRLDFSNKYAKARHKYGEKKAEIDLIYAGKILSLQQKKKNLGYETGLIMLMCDERDGQAITELYQEMIRSYNDYKAIERIIDAYDSRITAIQSIMRYNRERDGGG